MLEVFPYQPTDEAGKTVPGSLLSGDGNLGLDPDPDPDSDSNSDSNSDSDGDDLNNEDGEHNSEPDDQLHNVSNTSRSVTADALNLNWWASLVTAQKRPSQAIS